MSPLLQVDPARRAKEAARATEAEALDREWRRTWRLVYLQCMGLAVLGYVGFGVSFGFQGDTATILAAGSFVVAYVLPLLRLLVFFLRHADQF